MTVLYVILAILIFGLLILIHEGGHFLFARLFKVTVNEFSIGMGPAIFSRKSKKSGILYSLRIVPFGGYVSMAGEDEESEDENAFYKKPVWQRFVITAAGAAMNILSGVLVMTILVSTVMDLGSTRVAYFLNLFPEDEIVEIEDIPIKNDAEIAFHMIRAGEAGVTLTVMRSGEKLTLDHVTFDKVNTSFDSQSVLYATDTIIAVDGTAVSSSADLLAALLPENSAVAVKVQRGDFKPFYLTVSEQTLAVGSYASGLRENDVIVKVDGTSVHTSNEIVYELSRKAITPIDLTVIRDGERLILEDVVFPQVQNSGVTFGQPDFKLYQDSKTFGSVLKHSVCISWSTIKMVWESLYDLLTGRYGLSAVSGPVGVTQVMTEAASQSAADFIYLAVVISMNLGVMNLLPLPALDGGRLLFLIIEGIRRKPLSRKVEGYVHFAGFALLMMLMVVIMAKDIVGLFL